MYYKKKNLKNSTSMSKQNDEPFLTGYRRWTEKLSALQPHRQVCSGHTGGHQDTGRQVRV